MKMSYQLDRREFLELGAKFVLCLPMAYIGCHSFQTPELSPEDALRKLIFVLGPWTNTDKHQAEDFSRRFLAAKHTSELYLSDSESLVLRLARRFPDKAIAISKINLENLPEEERVFLLKLTQQLYSFIEVRFYIANEPPWGECQGDPLWHTRAP